MYTVGYLFLPNVRYVYGTFLDISYKIKFLYIRDFSSNRSQSNAIYRTHAKDIYYYC